MKAALAATTTPEAAPSPAEVAAGHMLSLLVEETERAHGLVTAGDGSSLDALLAARRDMLEELDRTVQALGAERRRSGHGGPPMSVARQRLIDMAAGLDCANSALLRTATAECASIAAAIKDLDRPDGVASAYASTGTPETRRLDLVR